MFQVHDAVTSGAGHPRQVIVGVSADNSWGLMLLRDEQVLDQLNKRGSGADRIVGAIRSGVGYGDAAYAAMTCRQITAGFDRHGIGIANWRL